MKMTQAMFDAIPLSDGEPIIGKTYRADGWVYRDLPPLSLEFYDKLIAIIGAENIVWLTQMERKWPEGAPTERGQCLINPTGLRNLAEHAASTMPTVNSNDV